jgi:predicted MFS family arabinose efflux permease
LDIQMTNAGTDSSAKYVGLATVIAGCTILALAAGLRQTSGVFLQPVTMDLNLSRQSFGLAVGVQNLVWGLSQPLAGYLADRYGARPIALVCGLMYSVGLALSSTAAGGMWLAATLGVLVGLGQAGTSYAVILAAVGKAVAAERRSSVLGLASAAGSLGMFVLVPIAQGLISSEGWRAALLFLAGLSFLGVLAAFAVGRPGGVTNSIPDRAAAERMPASPFAETVKIARRNGGWWLLTTGFTVCGFQLAFIATYLPSALTDASLSAATGAQVLATIGFANIVGTYLFGVAGRTRPKNRLLACIYLARGAALLLFVLAPRTALSAYAFGATMGLLWSATVPLTAGLVSDLFGQRNVGFLFALVYVGHQIGSFVGAWIGGAIYSATGSYEPVWVAAVLLSVLAAALHWPIKLPVLNPALPVDAANVHF